jgi:hypothetical protein
MGMRALFGLGKPKVAVQVAGDEIIVTLPGTSFQVTYKHRDGSLVATDFTGKDVQRKITMPVFLSQAWRAANGKAKELRWIA